jgi:membrane protease YdiL (CAAX protease family)
MAFDFVLILSAILWLVFFMGFRRIDLGVHWLITPSMWLQTAIYSVIWITLGVALAVKIGYISFAGWTMDWLRTLLMTVYLFFMALIEEIFFRGLILNYLYQFFPVYVWIPLILSVLIFGYAHLKKNGMTMVFLASLAGVFYGLTYIQTRNIFCATFIHTATNVCWLVFFKTNNEKTVKTKGKRY